MLGGAVLVNDPYNKYAEILRLKPNYILIPTGQLEAILPEIPDDAAPLTGVRVSVGGSQVSKHLADTARNRLSQDLWINYGSTELGSMATAHTQVQQRHDRAVGFVSPGLEVEVVDAAGEPVAAGETGTLRMRGQGLFSGYLDEEETTTSSWRDGWFYPGDLASLTEDDLLIIEGRVAEIINLGGVKIDPGSIDEVAKTCRGVRDAAAFAVPDEAGVERPWIAVVRGNGYDTLRLLAMLRARWLALTGINVILVKAIPRNAMAKVERQKLKQTALAMRKLARKRGRPGRR
jgi:acyl-CoA synthetase (AMP-forming)/AMP-acid ligase II